MPGLLDSILNRGPVARTRRNHALEHATLHVLAQRLPQASLAGHSTDRGFRILGSVPIETVAEAVQEAERRLRAGEHRLAVHPFCGTNFVTSGALAGLASASAMLGFRKERKDLLERLSLAMILSTLALIFAQPLAFFLQREVTTCADLGELRVLEVRRAESGALVVHHVRTQS